MGGCAPRTLEWPNWQYAHVSLPTPQCLLQLLCQRQNPLCCSGLALLGPLRTPAQTHKFQDPTRVEQAEILEARSRAKGPSQCLLIQVLNFKVLGTLRPFLHLVTIYIHKTVLVSAASTVLPSCWEALVRPMPAFQLCGELYVRDQVWGQKAEPWLPGDRGESGQWLLIAVGLRFWGDDNVLGGERSDGRTTL